MKERTGISLILCTLVLTIGFLTTNPCPRPAFTQGTATEQLTPEQIINMKIPGDVAISPDGSRVVYALSIQRTEGEETGRRHSEIRVADTASGESKRYTSSPGRSWSPRWSPDGSRIAFLTSRFDDEKRAQIYVMPLGGGEGERITDEESSVSTFRWFPDGERIAFLVTDPESPEHESAEEEGKDWTVVDSSYSHRRLWEIDVRSKEKRLLTPYDLTIHEFSISPDGKKIALTTAQTPRTDDSYMFKKLSMLRVGKRKLSVLYDPKSKMGNPVWSPDGKFISYNGGIDSSDPTPGSLFVVNAGNGEAVNLTEGFAGTVTWSDWLDPDRIVFVAVTGTKTALYTIGRDGSDLEALIEDGPVFTSMSLSRDRKHGAFRASTSFNPPEAYYTSIGRTDVKRLTWSNPDIEEAVLPEQETIRWKARDGLEIEGVLVKPIGYREGEHYPLVVRVHGGPEYAYLDGWNASYSGVYNLAGRGFVVFMPNYRGSYGRGVAYAKADHKDLGGRELTDIIDGIDHLADIGMIDRDRVGIMGGSYGGYLSALAATKYTERFKAAIVLAGITNWNSFIGTTDIPYENSLVHWDLWTYDEPSLGWERSAIAHIRKANTPVLIIHGEEDRRVPISQAEELYTALSIQGVSVKFVRYPRAGHGLSEREHQLDSLNRTLNWFETHLK